VLENDPYRIGLSARWTVFAGGSILAANRGAQAGVAVAEQEQRVAQHGITTELADRYFKRRLAADVLEVRRQAFETLTRHLEDARRLRAAGQIGAQGRAPRGSRPGEADREFKKSRRDVDLAAVALRSTLGTEVDAMPTTPLSLISNLSHSKRSPRPRTRATRRSAAWLRFGSRRIRVRARPAASCCPP